MADRQLGTLFLNDADLATEYAKCKDSKSTIVLLWEQARQKQLDLQKELKP